jgi:hypothetical protein
MAFQRGRGRQTTLWGKNNRSGIFPHPENRPYIARIPSPSRARSGGVHCAGTGAAPAGGGERCPRTREAPDSALRVLRPVREELAIRREARSALRTQARPGVGGESYGLAARTPRWSAGRRGAHACAPQRKDVAPTGAPSPRLRGSKRETVDAPGLARPRKRWRLFEKSSQRHVPDAAHHERKRRVRRRSGT